MGHGREGHSGLFWCFLKHRGKNVGYFWVQHWDSLLLLVPINTAAEGFKEELMNASEWKHRSQYLSPLRKLHKQLNKALAILSQILKRQQIIFLRIDKNNFSVKLVCPGLGPGLVWLDVASGCYDHNTGEKHKWRNTEKERKLQDLFMLMEAENTAESIVNAVWESEWYPM